MKSNLLFRAWFYFRTGWGTYFAFIFAAINTLTVTYFLAIERYPSLNTIFPSFLHYVVIVVAISIPLLVIVGYIHYKKSAAVHAEAEIGFETNPFLRRMLVNTEIVIPLQLKLIEVILKISKNEKVADEDLAEIKKIENELNQHIKLQKTKKKFNIIEPESYKKLQDIDKL
jgi:hypothetical protein